jgi:hypothetical protein
MPIPTAPQSQPDPETVIKASLGNLHKGIEEVDLDSTEEELNP